MLIPFFLMCFLGNESHVLIPDTGHFRPLNTSEVLVRPDGGIYILDFEQARVSFYDALGKKSATLGGKGAGPGEFVYPVSFYFDNDQLYVYDRNNNSVSIFDSDHKFIKRLNFPERDNLIEKVAGGWVYGNWDGRGHTGSRDLIFLDEALENPRLLLKVTRYGRGGGLYQSSSSDGVTAEFGGISRRAQIIASHDRQRIYLTDPLEFSITVIDLKSGKVVRKITKNIERLPFDEEWAERMLAERLEGRPLPAGKVKRDYPEFFPVIRNLMVDPDGYLLINMWRGNPDKNSHVMALDELGNEVTPRFAYKTLLRMPGLVDDMACITIYNSDSEVAGLAKVPADQADAFAAANPILYGETVTREISSSSIQ